MITNASMANIPYIGVLPTTITNFGGHTQVCVTENPYTPSMQVFGPQGYQRFNAGAGVTAQPNPFAVVSQAQSMLAEVFNKMASSNIDSALGAAITQKNQLIQKYNSGTASESVKAVIQAHVKELEKYERQLNYLKANAGNVDPQTAYQRSEYLKNTVSGVIDLGTTTIRAMETQSSQQVQQPTATTEGEKPEDNSLEAKAAKVKEDNIYTRAGEQDLDKDAVNTQYYNDMIDKLFKAMDGCGTDDTALEAELDKINKDNVLELMYIWNQKYPKESLMEMFMADAGPIQKKKYGENIAIALEQAAAELGIDLSNDEDMKAIKNEVFNSWFMIDNGVADNYNNIVKKLLAAAGVEYNYSPYSIWSK